MESGVKVEKGTRLKVAQPQSRLSRMMVSSLDCLQRREAGRPVSGEELLPQPVIHLGSMFSLRVLLMEAKFDIRCSKEVRSSGCQSRYSVVVNPRNVWVFRGVSHGSVLINKNAQVMLGAWEFL